MTSNFQFNKSLEWCTKFPTKGYPCKSPLFLANGNEWFFEFVLQQDSETDSEYYILNLTWKCTHTEFKPFSGKFKIEFGEEQISSIDDECFNVSKPITKEIWFISMVDLEQKQISRKVIKFIFTFDEPESLLKIKTDVDDKSVQTGSYLNAEVSVESLYEDFSKLLDAGTDHDADPGTDIQQHHDAQIKCGEDTIKVHRIILSARSKVFSTMLQSDMKEGRSGIIEIEDMDISSVQVFVKYLYTGAMPELDFDKAKMLYVAGDKYEVPSLMIRCSDYLQDNLSPENAIQIFALADAHSDQNLKDKVQTYILEKKMYLQDDLWSPFCKSFPIFSNEVYRLSYKRNVSERDHE